MKEDIKISSTGGGKSLSTTISYINPAVNNEDLATFGQMLTALTTNIYESTDRVTTVNCDTEEGDGIKPTPTLSMPVTSMTAAGLDLAQYTDDGIEIVTNSDGEIAISFSGFSGEAINYPFAFVRNNRLYLHKAVFQNTTSTGTIHITVLPSANFGISQTINFTLTA